MNNLFENKNLIFFSQLRKTYNNFSLKDISFDVKVGECVCLLGKNGSGKSTILNLFMKLDNLDSGEILFENKNIFNDDSYKNYVTYIGDSLEFFPNLRLKEIKNIYKIFYDNWSEEKYNTLLTSFFLDESRKLTELSSGMKVKFMICLTLASNPKLVVLDEALSGLDISSKINTLKILKSYVKDTKSCLLYTTHSLDEIENIADKLVIINDGSIVKIVDDEKFLTDDYKEWV